MLVPFKHNIEASKVGMAQASFMGQAPPIVQALLVAQTTYVTVPTSNAKKPKIIMREKFYKTRLKFRGFMQQVNLFLQLHFSCYPDESTQVAFIGSLLLGNAFSWFAPFLKKHSPILQDMAQFEALFTVVFGDSDRDRVAETRMQSLRQGTRSATIYAIEFQQFICNLEWNDKAFINRLRYGLKDNVKDLLITMPKVETL
jgi:hypothetical protein